MSADGALLIERRVDWHARETAKNAPQAVNTGVFTLNTGTTSLQKTVSFPPILPKTKAENLSAEGFCVNTDEIR
jgi:hypothetical protein